MAVHVETRSMVSPAYYTSRNLNHLGLVSGMVDELGIVSLIDCCLPKNEEKQVVSCGQAVKAMILNGLGFHHRALYLTPHFFQDKPVDRLLGEGIEAEHINDDLLGRTLDAIFRYDPTRLYGQIASQAVLSLGLNLYSGHLDTTSFHVDGNSYGTPSDDSRVIQITRGYSRDHRPDLNQIVLELICEGQAGIPLLMTSLSGNSNDKVVFRETIRTYISQYNADWKLDYLVADSALYTAETLAKLSEIKWITRVPETLTLARDFIGEMAPEIMAKRDEMAMQSLCVWYGGVRQRWIFVYSPEAYQRALKSCQKSFLKKTTAELHAFEKLCGESFACEADADKALLNFKKKLKYTEIGESSIHASPRYKRRGRPGKNQIPDTWVYQIEGILFSHVEPYQRMLQQKSCFILATNEVDQDILSNQAVLDTYKDQQKVERGFRFLKDPLFMASTVFLKSPQRIMALMMVMTLCLLVYAALEHRIRMSLQNADQSFPDQKGKLISNPTVRWVFQFFAGIHVLLIGEDQATLILNMNEHHWLILRLLGDAYERIYSGNG